MPEREPAGAGRQPRAVGGAGTLHRPTGWPASQWPFGHVRALPGGHPVWRMHRAVVRKELSGRWRSAWTQAAGGGS